VTSENSSCVQGSILGPRLFTLYLGDLSEEIQHDDIVTYADDSYVICHGSSIEELQERVTEISNRHVAYLRSKGMIVNASKTEIMVFEKDLVSFEIDGVKIDSTSSIKALGLTFQHDLKWTKHVDTILNKTRPKLALLRKIRKDLELEQYLKIATAQLFSKIYYASPVWLNETLSSDQWKRLKSLHYRILRVGTRDYKQKTSKKVLDVQCKRATPRMWSNYSTNMIVIKILRDRSPSFIFDTIMETHYTERRRADLAKFYDNSRGKVGKHRLCNRLSNLDNLPGWYGKDLNDHEIRIMLKDYLNFEYKDD